MQRIVQDIVPTGSAGQSQGAIEDQGITYNQAGLTYNEPGVFYGGFYGFSDVVPAISLSQDPIPMIAGYSDIYTKFVPPAANSGMLIGILGLTYP